MNKRALILGSNGYIGNSLMKRLDCDVFGVDNDARQRLVKEVGSDSLTPIIIEECEFLDIRDYEKLKLHIEKIEPDVIIHLAEQPSAPYSMKGQEEAVYTQENNLVGTMNVLWAIKEVDPNIHLIKLGTAGQYPDFLYPPEIQIPEDARIVVQKNGVDWEIPTPRYGGSFYHITKLQDSYLCDYANRIWGIDITDINQAPVYGHIDGVRFDVDYYFGTVVNRFIAQALSGMPLTVYGAGGQTRGYIHIDNAIEAISLVIQNRPKGYQTIHQLTETKSINEIAELVQKETGCEIQHIENPRVENDYNEFDFEMRLLKKWGLKPKYMQDSIGDMIEKIKPYVGNIEKKAIMPKDCAKWK